MQSIQKQSRRGGESESTGETALNVIVDLNPNVKGLNFFFFFFKTKIVRLEKKQNIPMFHLQEPYLHTRTQKGSK